MEHLPIYLTSMLTGFAVTMGLIVAIGAQNAWVLNKCLRNENPRAVAAVCISLDTLLIFTGVFFMHYVQDLVPALVPLFTWFAVGLLLWLALQAFIRAWGNQGGALVAAGAASTESAWRSAGQAMLISLINPHVYLDTVVLIGSVGARQELPLLFALGASFASSLWFSTLVLGAKKLRTHLSSPQQWRIFDSVIGVVMLLVAGSLVSHQFG